MFTVLILVYLLKGGLVGTHSIIAPDYATCEAARPNIEKQETARGTVLDPKGQPREILSVKGKCVTFGGEGV